jgi:hypothetical protein
MAPRNLLEGQETRRARAFHPFASEPKQLPVAPLPYTTGERHAPTSDPGSNPPVESASARNLVWIEHLLPVAPVGLGVEQRSVSILQERLSILTVTRVYANADAHRDVQILLVEAMWRAQRSEYLVATQGCVFSASHFREQHHEFIPTETTHRVGITHASDQASRGRLEKLIADRVTERIVDTFEVIHVHE